jgi:hypothetical protein
LLAEAFQKNNIRESDDKSFSAKKLLQSASISGFLNLIRVADIALEKRMADFSVFNDVKVCNLPPIMTSSMG